MVDDLRAALLELIRSNIAKSGHHLYVVTGGPLPRFAYTIGLSQTVGAELVVAGASAYTANDVGTIVESVAEHLSGGSADAWPSLVIQVESLGSFTLRAVHASWVSSLLLGAIDFYGVDDLPAVQVVPDDNHQTIDVPALDRPWDATSEPVWKWVHEPWPYSVPARSTAVTNLDALRSEVITEGARWELDEWELFAGAGPDVAREDVRVIPLATLLAADGSLEVVTTLEVGQGVWRDRDELRWHSWTRTP